MTTLRDRVRSALDRTAPTDAEARASLDAILAPKRPRSYRFIATAVTVAALAAIAFRYRPRPEDHGAHLYILVSGEPPESALSFDLSSPGAR